MTTSYMEYHTPYMPTTGYYAYNEYNNIGSGSVCASDQSSEGIKSPKSDLSSGYSPQPMYYQDMYKTELDTSSASSASSTSSSSIPSPDIKYSHLPEYYNGYLAPANHQQSIKQKSSMKKIKNCGVGGSVNPDVQRKRRLAANARERRRMNNLNDAYEQLRTVLRPSNADKKLSKYETLELAKSYMTELKALLTN